MSTTNTTSPVPAGAAAWPARSSVAAPRNLQRLAALFVLVFGDDRAVEGCIQPNSRAKLALEKAAGVTP